MDTEVSEEDIVCGVEGAFGFNLQRPCHTEGVSGYRRASFARSYSHAHVDTAEIFSFSGCRLSERQKCHSYSQNLYGVKEEFYGSAFLGQRLLCVYGWYG
jgi:hypothetical protein